MLLLVVTDKIYELRRLNTLKYGPASVCVLPRVQGPKSILLTTHSHHRVYII